jgi:hypothetical protein
MAMMARWRDGKGDEMKLVAIRTGRLKRGMDIAVSVFMRNQAYPSVVNLG